MKTEQQNNDRNNQNQGGQQGDKARPQPGKEGGYQEDHDKNRQPGQGHSNQDKNR